MNYLAPILGLVKSLLPMLGNSPQAAIERAVTIPKNQRAQLYKGMDQGDIDKAESLARVMFDAVADWVGFVASRGLVEPD